MTSHSTPLDRASRFVLAFAALAFGASLALGAAPVFAADTWDVPVTSKSAEDRDMAAGRKALADKQWAKAAGHFERVVSRDARNADAHNLLGYSYRWMDRMDDSFHHYGRALELQPDHRGAHEYVGIAHLKVGNVAKAEEHLARLRQICGADCEETRSLGAKLAEYRSAQR
ncbi:tetratricopeptide repeat protein [Schlegelella sp. S2-27]|uniref:Tetratricopeptide repeat protein n=1 Tax=Caldimonas mangrovi TaxID=2944811 RepID=A0ABT0YHH2_9BURK|nr:tetratricopeptide repeat protein [Caldimonas mangrovi]MCM5678160.1 tetratricopeptide repeat protein [Caldimonas mangrovi]